jgi:hypothetical protein
LRDFRDDAFNLYDILTLPAREGAAVAQLVEALRYKPEGRWFDSRFH